MTDADFQIDSLNKEMHQFLKSQARNYPNPSQPLYLSSEYKNNLKLTDSDKIIFQVEESYLSAFRQTYIDKAYKTVRLQNWQFELQFTGKKCNKISLISDHVTFFASKANKQEISGCHFKIIIVEGEAVKKLGSQINGYLNRLGKKNLCSLSYNVAKEVKSLLSFTKAKETKMLSFDYKPWKKVQEEAIDPILTINAQGRKVLQKLRHFISRQNIYDFMVEQQVSEEAVTELKKLISPPEAPEGGKKRGTKVTAE